MRKFWIQMGIFAVALTILVFYYFHLNMEWTDQEVMNRAQIARMLALLRYDSNTCEEIWKAADKEHIPSDVLTDTWYSKYVAAVLKENWMMTDEMGNFLPSSAFTYGDLKHILDQFFINEEMLSFSLKYRQTDGVVHKDHWLEVFKLIMIGQQEVQRVERIVYGSPKNMSELSAWQVMTDDGIKTAEGLSVDAYMNEQVEVYEKDDHILCIIDRTSDVKIESSNFEYEQDKIRVILHERENDYEHESVQITSDDTFYVIKGQDIWRYDAGATVRFEKEDDALNESTIVIKTESDPGKIQLMSVERACGTPWYDGEIQLQKGEQGIWVINQVAIEDYVAGVIPGEMPVSYGMEALKAQAVCTRTFAKRALSGNFQEYPANVDDTVLSQVYNNQLACPESIQAAKGTEGMVLKNMDGLTPTYFFSTSCGHTSNPEDVWYDGTQDTKENSVTVFLTNENVDLNLSHESDFRSFINLENEISYFEEDLPWFRWHVFISDESIEETVRNISGQDIGNLKQINIVERAESGVLKSIQIEGDKGEVLIHGEYRIRQIFSPKGAELMPQSGETVTEWELLPSGYFYFDALVEENVCEGYLLHGGGYGHGCGMSQNGAMKMAELGKNYHEILKYFFSDSEIIKE